MKKFLLSVIIPMFNSEKTIGKCLDSIYNSDYPRKGYEVIVVDDCSTDDSAKFVRRYPCKLIRLNKNKGPAAARNIGAKESKGDILIFVDSDVLIGKNFFYLTASSFKKGEVCLTAMNTGNFHNNFISSFLNLLDYSMFLRSSTYVILPCTSYFAIKREIFEDLNGFNEKYKKPYVEDLELGMRLVNEGQRIYLDKRLKFIHLKKRTFQSFFKNELFLSYYRIKILLSKRNIKMISSHHLPNILFLFLMIFSIVFASLFNKVLLVLGLFFLIILYLNNREFLKILKKEKGLIFALISIVMIIIQTVIWIVGITLGSISFFLGDKY